MELYILMSTYINVEFFCVPYSAAMVEDKASCASHLSTQLPDHQLVPCLGGAPGQNKEVCLTLCSFVSSVGVTPIPASSR